MSKTILPTQLEEATLIIQFRLNHVNVDCTWIPCELVARHLLEHRAKEFRRATVDELDRLIARTLGDLAAAFDVESLKLLNGDDEDGEAEE